ncbi:MAG: EamA family transporter [Pseudomonadota bacterium]
MTMAPKDVALGAGAALIWGATFPVTAVALEATPPIFFACIRFLAAALFIAVVPRPAVPWRTLILLGLLLGAGQYGFLFLSMTHGIAPGLASLLVHTQAFFTIVIAMVAFSERLTRRQALAMGLALLGLGFLVINRAEAGALGGLGLILLAALSGALGNNLLKSLGKVEMLGVAVWMSLAAPLPLLILSLVFESGGSLTGLLATITWTTLGAVAYSALLATLLAFAIWGRLFVTYPAASVAPFFLLVPVFGMSLSALLLGDSLSGLQIAGSLAIFTGLALALWPSKPAR